MIPIKTHAEVLNDSKFESISINDGLSNEYVTTIFQDSKGYMWIGTKDGLNRYDGEIIKIYNCNVEDDNTLSSTFILQMYIHLMYIHIFNKKRFHIYLKIQILQEISLPKVPLRAYSKFLICSFSTSYNFIRKGFYWLRPHGLFFAEMPGRTVILLKNVPAFFLSETHPAPPEL